MRTPHNECVSSDITEKSPPGSDSGSERPCATRKCVLCGESFPREELIRLAISPDGEVLPDPQGKAPGRGAWIAPDRAALETAMADGHLKKALLRAFKGGPAKENGERARLSYSDQLAQQIEDALTRTLLDRLGLERRGGNIVMGSAKLAEHARSGRIALLLHASDSSEDGRKKLDQAWRVGTDQEGSGVRGTVLPLDREALSVALGRENVVHLGVSARAGGSQTSKSASGRVGQAVTRLSRFLGNDPPT
ncbi:DUF448 domain-containing protein [uncultured Erythrobacter sp.]|uniref:DUF448 domain-containing protein n=1 Tax=uncultured Erythrobacter sp. TaxID=263913 RepID=UPI002601858D|nr:DUF448 domain-containing protein [uncultured Erythrobacter sp.]